MDPLRVVSFVDAPDYKRYAETQENNAEEEAIHRLIEHSGDRRRDTRRRVRPRSVHTCPPSSSAAAVAVLPSVRSSPLKVQ